MARMNTIKDLNSREKMDNKQVRVIDYELIHELKNSGRAEEAKQLLKAFHKDKKKSGKQARKDYDRKTRSVKKHLNLCTTIYCTRKAIKGKSLCEECLQYQTDANKKYNDKLKEDEELYKLRLEEKREYRKKRYLRNKEKRRCPKCGKDAAKDRICCVTCLEDAKLRFRIWNKNKKNG